METEARNIEGERKKKKNKRGKEGKEYIPLRLK